MSLFTIYFRHSAFFLAALNKRTADGLLLYKLKRLAWQSSHRTATQIQKGKANDDDNDNSRRNNINKRTHTYKYCAVLADIRRKYRLSLCHTFCKTH